jgi:hypothetical protein
MWGRRGEIPAGTIGKIVEGTGEGRTEETTAHARLPAARNLRLQASNGKRSDGTTSGQKRRSG